MNDISNFTNAAFIVILCAAMTAISLVIFLLMNCRAQKKSAKEFQQAYREFVGMEGYLKTDTAQFVNPDKKPIKALRTLRVDFPMSHSSVYPVYLPAKITGFRQTAHGGKVINVEIPDGRWYDFAVMYTGQPHIILNSLELGELILPRGGISPYKEGSCVVLECRITQVNDIVYQVNFVEVKD